MMANTKIKIISKSGRLPSYETEGSAGADLRAYLAEPVTLMPERGSSYPPGCLWNFLRE